MIRRVVIGVAVCAVVMLGWAVRGRATEETTVPVTGKFLWVGDSAQASLVTTVRQSNGQLIWYMAALDANGVWLNYAEVPWGSVGDVILAAQDYDNDGTDDPAVYRPSNHTWYVLKSSCGWQCYFAQEMPH